MTATVFGTLAALEREFVDSLSGLELSESHRSGFGFHGIAEHLASILPGSGCECKFFVDFVATHCDPGTESIGLHNDCS